MTVLPPQVSECTELSILDISHNQLKALPANIGKQRAMLLRHFSCYVIDSKYYVIFRKIEKTKEAKSEI